MKKLNTIIANVDADKAKVEARIKTVEMDVKSDASKIKSVPEEIVAEIKKEVKTVEADIEKDVEKAEKWFVTEILRRKAAAIVPAPAPAAPPTLAVKPAPTVKVETK